MPISPTRASSFLTGGIGSYKRGDPGARGAYVEIDATDAIQMLGQLEEISPAQMADTLLREANQALATITYSHRDRTGDLRRGTKIGAGGANKIRIANDVFYARFVFRGTRKMDARPPDIRYSSAQLADAVAAAIF